MPVQADTTTPCVVEHQGICLWPAAADDDKPRQLRRKSHAGESGLTGHDGQPAPAHTCTTCHDEPDLLPADHRVVARWQLHSKTGFDQPRPVPKFICVNKFNR
jgi:hypothetical protein